MSSTPPVSQTKTERSQFRLMAARWLPTTCARATEALFQEKCPSIRIKKNHWLYDLKIMWSFKARSSTPRATGQSQTQLFVTQAKNGAQPSHPQMALSHSVESRAARQVSGPKQPAM